MDTLEIKESPAYFKEETSLRKKIEQVLKPYQPLLWGVCDPPPDLKNPGIYEKVLIVAVPFLWPLKLTEYKEPIFKHLQSASFERYGKIS
ncbi:MAG: hypothetical protein LBK69_06655, partial [Syntrophomonadaceae bacterium]|nr:hypothetical protein [Syntrophomonadaceae bacterium]